MPLPCLHASAVHAPPPQLLEDPPADDMGVDDGVRMAGLDPAVPVAACRSVHNDVARKLVAADMAAGQHWDLQGGEKVNEYIANVWQQASS